MRRILVTGSAGFIGSHLVERLASRGDRVVGIDCFDPYYSVARKRRTAAALLDRLGVETIELDLRDRDALLAFLRTTRFDAVVHLAALPGVRPAVTHPERYIESNFIATQNLLDGLRAGCSDHLVFASTSSIYGDAASVPFRERDAADRPLQPYAAAKRAVEVLAHAYHHLYGLHFTSLRLFTVYGPRNRPDMMAYRLAESIHSGRAVEVFDGGRDIHRDWTFVGDVAGAFVRAVDRPFPYEIINVGRGAPVELRAFIAALESAAGGSAAIRSVPMPPCDMRCTHACVDKARRLLGHESTVGLADGAAALWSWFARHASETSSPTSRAGRRPASFPARAGASVARRAG